MAQPCLCPPRHVLSPTKGRRDSGRSQAPPGLSTSLLGSPGGTASLLHAPVPETQRPDQHPLSLHRAFRPAESRRRHIEACTGRPPAAGSRLLPRLRGEDVTFQLRRPRLPQLRAAPSLLSLEQSRAQSNTVTGNSHLKGDRSSSSGRQASEEVESEVRLWTCTSHAEKETQRWRRSSPRV